MEDAPASGELPGGSEFVGQVRTVNIKMSVMFITDDLFRSSARVTDPILPAPRLLSVAEEA